MNPFKYGETVGGENFCRRPEFACVLKGYGDWSECSDVGRTAHGQDVPRVRDGSWHYGPVLPEGKWTRLKVVNDCEKIGVFMDGKSVLSFPISMPASNTLAPILGGSHMDGLGFFKGRLRNLRISQQSLMRLDFFEKVR